MLIPTEGRQEGQSEKRSLLTGRLPELVPQMGPLFSTQPAFALHEIPSSLGEERGHGPWENLMKAPDTSQRVTTTWTQSLRTSLRAGTAPAL